MFETSFNMISISFKKNLKFFQYKATSLSTKREMLQDLPSSINCQIFLHLQKNDFHNNTNKIIYLKILKSSNLIATSFFYFIEKKNFFWNYRQFFLLREIINGWTIEYCIKNNEQHKSMETANSSLIFVYKTDVHNDNESCY